MFKIITLILLVLFALPHHAQSADDLMSKLPDDKVLGSAKAKITLIEYASLSCHHCADFHNNVLPTIQKEYIDTGKVRLIFRDFPLNAPALAGAQMAHCAARQGGNSQYYAALKAMFEKQNDWAFGQDAKPKLMAIANGLGLEEKALSACMEDKELETKIVASRQDGTQKMKVEATPSFFVNGEKAEHMRSVEDARKTLNTLLSGKSLEKAAKEAAKKATIIREDDIVLGKSKASVAVLEYTNIACSHCGQFHKNVMEALQKDYIDTGKVKFAFRELPMSPATFYAYVVAHCKGKKEFYTMLSLLIDETKAWAGTHAFLPPLQAVAEKAGVSKEAFYTCLENKEIEARILSNAKEAKEALGINHSPALYINGEKTEGLESVEDIRQAVEAAVKKKQ